MEWCKLYSRIRIDPKLNMRSKDDRWAWVCLLCLANEGADDDRGNIRLFDEEISFAVYLEPDQWDCFKDFLLERGMLEGTSGDYRLTKWDALQGRGLTVAQRVRKHREETSNDDVTLQKRYSNVQKERKKERKREREERKTKDSCASRTELDVDPTKSNSIPFEELTQRFNELCPSLPKVLKLTDQRKKAIRARWEDMPDLSGWADFFRRVEASDWLSGRIPRKPPNENWKVTLDYLLRPDVFTKVLEGVHDNTPDGGDSPTDRLKKTLKLLEGSA